MHEVYASGDDQCVREHPGPKGKGLRNLGTAYGLGEGRREKLNPSFQEIDKNTVLEILEAEHSNEAVACL
jgi:hypothetical protein